MLTMIQINKIVAKEFNITPQRIMGISTRQQVATPRNVAMLMCQRYLGWSSLVIQYYFKKKSHTTILSNLKRAKNLIDTDKSLNLKVQAIEKELSEKIESNRIDKQRYNLHHRLREKELRVNTQHKTVSLSPDEEEKIKSGQLLKLLQTHHYSVQYSID